MLNAVEDGSVYILTLVVLEIEVNDCVLRTPCRLPDSSLQKRQLSPLSMRPCLRKASLRSLTSLTDDLVNYLILSK